MSATLSSRDAAFGTNGIMTMETTPSSPEPPTRPSGERMLGSVRVRPLPETGDLVHVLEPRGRPPALASWLREHEPELDAMGASRALLARGFGVDDRGAFGRIADDLLRPMPYVYRSTPRTAVGEGVYTATEYPAERGIPLHGENAYQDVWPSHLLLYCDQPARRGGETPLADVARITAAIPTSIKDEFRRKKIRYVRNYRVGLDLSWQTVFQTDDRSALEAYCRAHGISWTWSGADGLRTEQVCDAMVEHPRTKATLWFNQAHLFHVGGLDDATRAALLSVYEPDQLPRHATYGDGTPIDPATIAEIGRVFEQHARAFEWLAGDTLLIDNLLVAHGRNPYAGPRTVLVSMGRRRSLDAQGAA